MAALMHARVSVGSATHGLRTSGTSPKAAAFSQRRLMRRARAIGAPTLSYTGWVLDAPGCVSFREIEQTESGDRRVTKKALRIQDTSKIAEIFPNLPVRLEKTVPVDISEAMHQMHSDSVIVGDKKSFEAFVASASDAKRGTGGAGGKPLPLVVDVSEW